MDFIEHVGRDGAALTAAARGPGVEARTPIPTCPDWDMAGLVGHTGAVHRWATEMVTARATERAAFPDPPAAWDERLAWFDDGLPMLLTALAEVGPDEPVWNWADRAPAPARFWPRRMAHETAVHRWDAQHAADPGGATPLDDELAIDGIEEYLGFVARRSAGLRAHLRPDGTLEVDTDDAAATLHGQPSDLLLWMTGRLPRPIAADGDLTVLDTWERSVHFS